MKCLYTFIGILLIGGIVYSKGWAQDTGSIASMEETGQQQNLEELKALVAKAKQLYSQKNPDLALAIQTIRNTAAERASQFHTIACQFYMYSLANADYKTESETIEAELKRLLPLVADSVQKSWESLFKHKDDRLFSELTGFWEINDPYPSTPINERLLLHWSRIAYAQKHFTKADNSPYGTDDRGTFYVRLGPPLSAQKYSFNGLSNLVISKFLSVQSKRYSFQNTSGLKVTFEIWKYHLGNGKTPFFIFGKRDGRGNYGLRRSAFEIIDMDNVRLEDIAKYAGMSATIQRRLFKGLAQLSLLKGLAPYNTQYSNEYYKLLTRIEGSPYSITRIMSNIEGNVVRDDEIKTDMRIKKTPAQQTDLTNTRNLKVTRHIYRFLNEKNHPEYVIALQSAPDFDTDNKFRYVNQNKVFIYNDRWEKLLDRSDMQPIAYKGSNKVAPPSLFVLPDDARGQKLFYSSELINTGFDHPYKANELSGETARIETATGKQKFALPAGLQTDQPLLISDVVLSKKLTDNKKERIPVMPSLNNQFKAGSELTIYFETYNIPKGGYSFTYFFKKDRWLLSNKKIERTKITILADKVHERDSQLFSISLKDLEPGSYELILEFTPLDPSSGIEPRQKKINLEIIKLHG